MDNMLSIIQNAIDAHPVSTLAEQYHAQKDMLVIPNFLSPEFVTKTFIPEIEHYAPHIHRVYVPGFKKSGSVSYHHLKQASSPLLQIYQCDIFKRFIEAIVGTTLFCCPEHDAHAAALYYYTEPGDRIGVHYDKSFYKGKRFTVLLGMIQDSTQSQLICYPGSTKRNRKKNPTPILTHPGTLVVFNGDTLWHEVTALGANERRVILTMEFLTNVAISPFSKWLSDFKDRLLYFGKKAASIQKV